MKKHPASEPIEAAANVRLRSDFIDRIKRLIEFNGWSQAAAARLCGISTPRINDLVRGRVVRFSLDALVNMAAALGQHSKPQEKPTMEHTEDEGQRMAAEFMEKMNARPVKGTYDLATQGGKTARGGEVATASTGMEIDGHRIACVGDLVRYPDGSESKIVSGAGAAFAFKGQPMAIVGSATDNGDTITSSLQNKAQIREYADDAGIPGLLQPGYVSEPQGNE